MKIKEIREIPRNIERVKTPEELEEEEWQKRIHIIQTTSLKAIIAQNERDAQQK